MKRYSFGILALWIFGIGCQSPETSSHANINDFTNQWVASVEQANASQLSGYLSSDASAEAIALTGHIQQAKNLQIDIRLKVPEALTEKLAPHKYRIKLPFILSGPVGLRKTGVITLSVQEDVFGAYKIADVSDHLRRYLGIAYDKASRANPTHTRKIVTSRDTILAKAGAVKLLLTNPGDEIIFYTYVDTTLLFYVARGNWDYSTLYEDQPERSYQLGVVDEEGNEVIPVSFEKIYNPGGTFPNLIEVERDGQRGFYNVQGQPVVSVSFDAIYPYSEASDVLAQVRFDGRYGWIDSQGNLHLNPDSHSDKSLFESPLSSDRLIRWTYKTHQPGLSYLRLPNQNNEHDLYGAVIVSPSYLYDLGMVAEYNTNILVENDDWDGAGVTEGHVSLVELVPLARRVSGLIAKFVEWGADARGYHEEIDRLITLNKDSDAVAALDFHGEYRYHVSPLELPFQETALFETQELKQSAYAPYDEMTFYSYYQIESDGQITALSTHRLFSFTKFIKISEENFQGEFKNYVETIPNGRGENINLVIANHLSLEDLDVMRNEIFADYGYRFQSEKWQTYFGQQPWYTPRYENVDDMLTDVDRYNVQFIHNFQKKMREHESKYIRRDSVYYMEAG